MYDTVKGSDWLGMLLVKLDESFILFAVLLFSIWIGCLLQITFLYELQ